MTNEIKGNYSSSHSFVSKLIHCLLLHVMHYDSNMSYFINTYFGRHKRSPNNNVLLHVCIKVALWTVWNFTKTFFFLLMFKVVDLNQFCIFIQLHYAVILIPCPYNIHMFMLIISCYMYKYHTVWNITET